MASEQEIVTKKIESGEYYAEAMKWFHEKFTRPRTEFTYFSIICLIAVVAFMVGLAAFSEIFPLSPGKNFVMIRPIATDEHLSIKGIVKSGDTPNDAIMKFMLTQYVQAREEYIEEKLDRNFRIIKTFSGPKVYDQYLDDTSVNNPQNPVILYGKQASIGISVDDIHLLDGLGKPAHDANITHAIVNYTTILTYASDDNREIKPMQADISFQYRQINVDQKTGKIREKPDMKITSYKINPIKTVKTK